MAKGQAPDELVVRKRSLKSPGEQLSKLEQEALKKQLVIEKELQALRDLEFLKRLHLEDFDIFIRPEHKKVLDIQERVHDQSEDGATGPHSSHCGHPAMSSRSALRRSFDDRVTSKSRIRTQARNRM